MRHAGFLALLISSGMCFHALALAAGKLPAANAYNQRLKTIVDKALHSALKKHPGLNGTSMKIHYVVDRDGHVHDVKVTSRAHDNGAERIVANTLAAITFPPIPMDAQLEVGGSYFELDAEVTLATDGLAVDKAESPTYYSYRMQVSKIMQDDLEPSFHAAGHLEVDYEFYLDPHGKLTSMTVHAKAGGKRAEQTVARSIRRIKYPPIPPKVFEELKEKPPLKIYGTMTWDPSHEVKPVGGPNASLVILPGKGCAVAIIAVDNHHFNSPQKQVSVPPGRHVLLLHVTEMGPDKGYADAPLEETFEPSGRYSITGTLSMEKGTFDADFVNERKRPRGK